VVLPDYDLVEIDVATMKIRKNYAAVGTINSGAALRPGTNEIWIANTDARNLVRFVTKVRGHALDNRVTRVTTSGSGSVTPFDLNPSINYGVLPNSTALSSALAQPKDVVWDAAGKTMFVAAFGTDRIGIVDPTGKVTGFIEVGNTAGTKVDSRNKRGPRGLALHSSGVLYVLNRLSNSISAIDTSTKKVLWELGLFDPTPSKTKQGRGFLYDAKLSGNATFSCGSCHVDGDTDGLAWDLGDPGGDMFETRSGPTKISLHPMKGPMLTQTLKGLKNTGPFHWRGDKPKLQDFNEAFDALMGKTELATADMDDFAAFMETILFPPNPNRTLSDKLATQSAMDGENLYTNVPFAQGIKCISCHVIPTGTNRFIIPRSILMAPQSMKTAQLRNIYKRTGFRKTSQGRKSGFGLTHDGEKRDSFDFLGLPVFNILSNNTAAKLMIQDFLQAFPTESAPAVGYQVTVNSANVNSSSVIADVGLLQIRAEAGDIDLIVKGQVDGRSRGMLYQIIAKHYLQDSASASPMTWAQISALIKTGGAEFTLTGVAPGTGKRSGIDRDADGVLDRDEGVELYGVGTKGCAGTPFLGTSSAPYIGNKLFSFVGRNAMSKSAGFLAVGLSPASFSLLGITVLVDITKPSTGIMSVFSDANGELALPLPIPNDIALVGLAVFNQIAWSDNCASQRVSATQGLKITITK
jgi:hypothetical protein